MAFPHTRSRVRMLGNTGSLAYFTINLKAKPKSNELRYTLLQRLEYSSE